MKYFWILFFLLIVSSCKKNNGKEIHGTITFNQYITVLGTAQDGGYPHIGCQKKCCADVYSGKSKRKSVVSLGLIDKENRQKWLFDATPDLHTQLATLEQHHLKKETLIDGIFLTHAHIGHYTGLMYFGREAFGKKDIPVFTMPKMKNYLENNGPWSQLISLQNIVLKNLQHNATIALNSRLKVTPFLVPHRDEFSETVGYNIKGTTKTALYIPDITEVPHPFIEETVSLFEHESMATKNKIIFIHFNHTNPALQENSKERNAIEKLGFRFASEGDNYQL